jgi:hypothetical protein
MTVLNDSISTAAIKHGSRNVSLTKKNANGIHRSSCYANKIVLKFRHNNILLCCCKSWMRPNSLVPRLQMYLLYQRLVINEYGAWMEWSVALRPPKTLHALQCDQTRSLRCEDSSNLLRRASRRELRLALSTKSKQAVNFLTINTKCPKQIHKDRVFCSLWYKQIYTLMCSMSGRKRVLRTYVNHKMHI